MLIYFAGPLFNVAERTFNAVLTEKLEALGYHVFLPQRDGVERGRAPYNRMTPEERRSATFTLDKTQVFACDVFLFVLDGRTPDEGACVELGLAYAHKELRQPQRRLIGLHTDSRAAFPGSKLNPMLSVPLDEVYETEEELLAALTAGASGAAK